VPAANAIVADKPPEPETEAVNVVLPQPKVTGVDVVVNPNSGTTTDSSSPTVITVFSVNVNANGAAVDVLVFNSTIFRLLKADATIAVDDAIAVAAMSVDPAKVIVAVREVKSAFFDELGVVAPDAMVSSQNVCLGNTAVPAVNVNAAPELEDPLVVTVNAVEPHPLSIIVDGVPQTKSGSSTAMVSPVARSAVSENENDTDVAVDVSGDANVSLLALIVG